MILLEVAYLVACGILQLRQDPGYIQGNKVTETWYSDYTLTHRLTRPGLHLAVRAEGGEGELVYNVSVYSMSKEVKLDSLQALTCSWSFPSLYNSPLSNSTQQKLAWSP
jgi:hypothetical protein